MSLDRSTHDYKEHSLSWQALSAGAGRGKGETGDRAGVADAAAKSSIERAVVGHRVWQHKQGRLAASFARGGGGRRADEANGKRGMRNSRDFITGRERYKDVQMPGKGARRRASCPPARCVSFIKC
jgi:hypothetical protein